jgi:hypothetical protein
MSRETEVPPEAAPYARLLRRARRVAQDCLGQLLDLQRRYGIGLTAPGDRFGPHGGERPFGLRQTPDPVRHAALPHVS